jgi:lauroyl/myristoyl acyltransferase
VIDGVTLKLITAKDVYLLCVITIIQLVYRVRSGRLRLLVTRTVAFLAYRLSSRKRRLSEENLCRAFEGQVSKERRRAVVKGSFYQFWLDVFSMPYRPRAAEVRSADICGLEHLQNSLKRGNGAILWESSYFGRRNLAKHILYENGFAVDQVHASSHLGGFDVSGRRLSWALEQVIRPFFENCERSFVREIIYLGDPDSLAYTKVMISRLRNNGILCISAEGTRGHKFVSTALFGRGISCATGAVSLARITDTPILPLFCFADTMGTKLTILPALEVPRRLQRDKAAEYCIHQFVALLESRVRKYPEQYRKWDYSSASQSVNL